MTTETMPLYRRYQSAVTAPRVQAKPTRVQTLLEFALFGVFGVMIAVAAIALVVTNTDAYRSVPNAFAAGVKADRVNVLLASTSSNAAANNVDTHAFLLLSVKPSTHEVAVTAIPRDLWVSLGKYGRRPLAAALPVGNNGGYPGAGVGLASDTVAQITGQQVHAYLALDDAGLRKAIDAVGGIDIDVHKGVFDYKYRDRFTPGRHHLNGRRALRYALSPYVTGNAATRPEHEARQQEVLTALLRKATTPSDLARLQSLSVDASSTNLTADQLKKLGQMVQGRSPHEITLADYVDAFDVATFVYTGTAVRPRGGDFQLIQRTVASVFTQQIAAVQ